MCKNMRETWMDLDDVPEFHEDFFLRFGTAGLHVVKKCRISFAVWIWSESLSSVCKLYFV